MNTTSPRPSAPSRPTPPRALLANLLVAPPALLFVVGLLHFRSLGDAFHFKARWIAPSADSYVHALSAAGPSAPLFHDPHMLGYLGLPLFAGSALAMYTLGRRERPLLAATGVAISLTGLVFLGGLFGTWAALFYGFRSVPTRDIAAATEVWAAITANTGALFVTTTLAKLGVIGPALQSLTLWNVRDVPRWTPVLAAAGYLIILTFWDLDNWMMLGELAILVAMVRLRTVLVATTSPDRGSP